MEFYTAKYTYRLDFSSKAPLVILFSVTVNSRQWKFLNLNKFLLSDEADKCDNGEAAADQALPPLRHRL